MMEQLQFDLNLVKKESQYFEDYGQNAGNILDNIIPEPEFDHFGQAASNVVSTGSLNFSLRPERFRFFKGTVRVKTEIGMIHCRIASS